MVPISNLGVFEELKKKYETITLEEITSEFTKLPEEVEFSGRKVAHKITGFGDSGSCSLCGPIHGRCYHCFWIEKTKHYCYDAPNRKSYDEIAFALTPEELLSAFRNRAKRMEEVLNGQ